MGKGKTWTPEECLHLAEAYLEVSEDQGGRRVTGTNQNKDMFYNRVIDAFKDKAEGEIDGTYGERTDKAIINQWKDNIKAQVRKFNKCLNKVFSSKPTGISKQEKINCASAIICGETKSFQCTCKECDAGNWKFYECWKLLKNHRGFQPPKDPTAGDHEEEDEEEEHDEEVLADDEDFPTESLTEDSDGGAENNGGGTDTGGTTTDTGSVNAPVGGVARTLDCTVVSATRNNNKRRGGGGRDRTKRKSDDSEYKKK